MTDGEKGRIKNEEDSFRWKQYVSFSCNACDIKFTDTNSLKKHIESDHDLSVDADEFNLFASDDPFQLWESLRPIIMPTLSLWDILVDKSAMSAKEKHLGNVPNEKLTEMMYEMDNLIGNITNMLHDCYTPVEENNGDKKGEEILTLSQLFSFLFFDAKQVVLNAYVPPQYKEQFFSTDANVEAIKEEDVSLDAMAVEEETVKKKKVVGEANPPKYVVKKYIFPFNCVRCQKVLNNKRAVKYHRKRGCYEKLKENMWQKIKGGLFYCLHPDCGMPDGIITVDSKSYEGRSNFWKHLVAKHSTEKDMVYICESCPKRYPFETMLKFHHTEHHSKRFTCETCGATFSVRKSLTKHKRVHTGEKPYACPHCPYRSATSLSYHKKSVHADIYKPQLNMCEQCGKGFVCKEQLREHSFTHTDIKRFSCEICGRQLKNDSCYRRHMVCVHGKKLTCELCGKDYSAKLGLMKHKRKEHGIMY